MPSACMLLHESTEVTYSTDSIQCGLVDEEQHASAISFQLRTCDGKALAASTLHLVSQRRAYKA